MPDPTPRCATQCHCSRHEVLRSHRHQSYLEKQHSGKATPHQHKLKFTNSNGCTDEAQPLSYLSANHTEFLSGMDVSSLSYSQVRASNMEIPSVILISTPKWILRKKVSKEKLSYRWDMLGLFKYLYYEVIPFFITPIKNYLLQFYFYYHGSCSRWCITEHAIYDWG